MSTAEEPAEIVETQLTLHISATIAVTTTSSGWDDWIKPGASFSTKWKGFPTEEQLALATQYIQVGVLAPTLDEVIRSAQARLVEARRGT